MNWALLVGLIVSSFLMFVVAFFDNELGVIAKGGLQVWGFAVLAFFAYYGKRYLWSKVVCYVMLAAFVGGMAVMSGLVLFSIKSNGINSTCWRILKS